MRLVSDLDATVSPFVSKVGTVSISFLLPNTSPPLYFLSGLFLPPAPVYSLLPLLFWPGFPKLSKSNKLNVAASATPKRFDPRPLSPIKDPAPYAPNEANPSPRAPDFDISSRISLTDSFNLFLTWSDKLSSFNSSIPFLSSFSLSIVFCFLSSAANTSFSFWSRAKPLSIWFWTIILVTWLNWVWIGSNADKVWTNLVKSSWIDLNCNSKLLEFVKAVWATLSISTICSKKLLRVIFFFGWSSSILLDALLLLSF